jgi:hypothetical protein
MIQSLLVASEFYFINFTSSSEVNFTILRIEDISANLYNLLLIDQITNTSEKQPSSLFVNHFDSREKNLS